MPHFIAMASATTTQDNGAGQGSGRETQPAPEIDESPNAAMVVSPVPFVTPPSPSAPEGEAFRERRIIVRALWLRHLRW